MLHDETKMPERHNMNAAHSEKMFLTCLPPQTRPGEKPEQKSIKLYQKTSLEGTSINLYLYLPASIKL